ncbi:pyridoxal phosphate-dependent aminotransferase [Legionella pneumophila]|uniref:Aminotransferase n=1 Tax=Legionella pneumophila subsp. pascullei TaxID=91890 RepID=A0AAX2J1K8_LEGPN|nr:aminotransferase class I/II-fold pyridoxal phosphate-dependent enzyme [Legionella pneumophila]AMP88903.1 aspartate aminotransferase [Legionella pneumophila subsp. pascullei]AMP93429.1 aspartate aminotransferase [Legionella pneumophila subsp. pascullei]AMP96397.1 aspartate aminotransferase [Legionella pneumophila subsp. pascullei]SQG91369.1 aspartate aminotransferase [Legionella pneumophila subsp. pascullei]VEH07915.1 aspartate aminotransferase [Legionella pneumophila subsp. pascullei]
MTYCEKKCLPKDSATVAINSLAQLKINAGIKIHNLSAGEPKLPPHPSIINAVTQAMEQGHTLYPPIMGIPELRKLSCEWMNRSYNCSFQQEHCLVVNGGKLGIYLLMQLLLQPNDEVIIPSPYWVSYPAMVELFAGTPVIMETTEVEEWKLTPQALKKACSAKSKILILNNANNPTGALYTQSELTHLLQVAEEHNLLVISDEVYSELTYDDHHYVSCGSFPQFRERVIIIQSCSKNFSMTGWRVGFIFAPELFINPLTSLVSQSTSGVTTLSQWAAVAALQEANQVNEWVQQNMQKRRDCLVQSLHDYLGLTITSPVSSLYVFLSLKKLGFQNQNSEEFCKQALDKANVAIVPGIAFGKEGYVRLSFGGGEEDLKSGIYALAQWLHH